MKSGDTNNQDKKNLLYCSFCGKNQHEVEKMIAGPTVFICDECIDLCEDIILEGHSKNRSILKIKVLSKDNLDDIFYDTIAAFLNEKYPTIDLVYESRNSARGSEGSLNSVVLFSFNTTNEKDAFTESELEKLREELSESLIKLSVMKQKYAHESEKVQNISKKLLEIKAEYLDYIRKNEYKSEECGQLASVVFIDVKGFSLLNNSEKKRVLDMIRGAVPLYIASKGASNINMWGDGIVCIFDNVNDSVACAIKFLRHLAVEELEARIGMAWGGIRIAYNPAIGRTDIDGATVDFAARIEPLAAPGEILLSTEYMGHEIDPSLGTLVKVKIPIKKAFSIYKIGDEIELYRLRVNKN